MEKMEGKNMEYIYAAMLLHKAGKEINEKNLTGVLTAAGINADPVRLKALVASLSEVDIDEAIKTPPAFITAAPAPTAPAPSPEEKPAKEKKKEEEEKKAKEEVALEGLGALFG
ncbi:MAG: 50S ribosomal protein P1 [Candidatus Bathyarchaeia archaeon]